MIMISADISVEMSVAALANRKEIFPVIPDSRKHNHHHGKIAPRGRFCQSVGAALASQISFMAW